MMMKTNDRRHDIEALRHRRADAADRADALQSQFEKFPHREIKLARDDAVRLVDRYDQALAAMST
jgi:hypothetical protein